MKMPRFSGRVARGGHALAVLHTDAKGFRLYVLDRIWTCTVEMCRTADDSVPTMEAIRACQEGKGGS